MQPKTKLTGMTYGDLVNSAVGVAVELEKVVYDYMELKHPSEYDKDKKD